jgi:cysteine-rich repeat protein
MSAGSGTVWFDKVYFGTDTYCGNGVVNAAQGEACDDGNRFGCDGCSANCAATETLTQWYSDFDHDGYGVNPPLELTYCPLDADRAPNNTDCDDDDPAIHTGCGPGCTSGTVCRAAAGACDVAEICSGGGTCPDDGFASSGTVCRAAAGVCDVAETCSGSSAACPSDAWATSGTVCRAAADACDVAETCSGSSAPCPSDGFLAAGSAGSPTCSPYVCGGAASCPTSCASSADCASGYTCSSNVCVAGATNIVVNPSFESTPSASDWGATLPSAFSRVTSPTAQAATYSMKFTTTKANTFSLVQQRNVSASTVYGFSGYIQTASMTGTGSSFRLVWMNGATVVRIDTVGTALTGTNGWTLRSASYTSPSNATSVKIELYSVTGSTGGNAYFDNLSLVQQ